MLWLKLLIISLIVTGFFMAAMAFKLFFDKKAALAGESCDLDEKSNDESFGCSHCKVKEIIDCKKTDEAY